MPSRSRPPSFSTPACLPATSTMYDSYPGQQAGLTISNQRRTFQTIWTIWCASAHGMAYENNVIQPRRSQKPPAMSLRAVSPMLGMFAAYAMRKRTDRIPWQPGGQSLLQTLAQTRYFILSLRTKRLGVASLQPFLWGASVAASVATSVGAPAGVTTAGIVLPRCSGAVAITQGHNTRPCREGGQVGVRPRRIRETLMRGPSPHRADVT